MFQFIHAIMEAVLASVILLPILLILNHVRFQNPKQTILYLFLTIYLTGVYAVVGLPNISYIRFDPSIQWIPFAGMLSDLSGTIWNIIMLVPLGLFLPLLWKPFLTLGKTLITGFCFSLAIELLQIFTYRATDVNDLITNVLGVFIGWSAAHIMLKFFPACSCPGKTQEFPMLTAISFGVMFFFQPLIWMIIE